MLWVRAPLSKQYLKLQLFFRFPTTRPIPPQCPVPRSFSFHEPGPFTTHRHHVALLKAFYSPASVFALGGEDGSYFAGLLGFVLALASRENTFSGQIPGIRVPYARQRKEISSWIHLAPATKTGPLPDSTVYRNSDFRDH